ncbi:hypothetical protein pb186bvf_006800, partial [Paramecium bursaria]
MQIRLQRPQRKVGKIISAEEDSKDKQKNISNSTQTQTQSQGRKEKTQKQPRKFKKGFIRGESNSNYPNEVNQHQQLENNIPQFKDYQTVQINNKEIIRSQWQMP